MTATVLDFFRAQRNDPLYQFLTWYMVLVMEWKLEDIAFMRIGEWREEPWGRHKAGVSFDFRNGETESWMVVKTGTTYYVEMSWKIVKSIVPEEREQDE